MEISYEVKFQEQEAARKAAALDVKNRAVFEQALDRWYLKEHEANFRLLVQWSPILTIEAIAFLMDEKTRPAGCQPDMTTREKLIAELVELLRDPTERRMTAHDLHTKTVQLAGKTLAELRAYRRKLNFKQEYKTAEQAREYLKTQRSYARPKYAGYEDLPETMTVKGEAVARTTKDALLWYSKNDFWYFKNRIVPRYGSRQINDCLSGS